MIIGELPTISRGAHADPSQGACVMEMVSYLNGDEWTDFPTCTLPEISGIAQAVNDTLPVDDRHLLSSQFDRLFGTAEIQADPDLYYAFLEELCKLGVTFASDANFHDIFAKSILKLVEQGKVFRAWEDLSMEFTYLISGKSAEDLISFLSSVLDIADKVLRRTEYPVIDVTPLHDLFAPKKA